MHGRANPWTSAAKLREQLTIDALLHGAGHAQVVRLSDDTPYELHRLEPSKVQRDQEPDGEPFFRVSTDAGQVRLSYREVLRIEAVGGVAPITLGREAIALAISFENAIWQRHSRMVHGHLVSSPAPSESTTLKHKKASLRIGSFSFPYVNETVAPAILEEGMQYQSIAMTLADAQFAENRLEQINEIARVFRVPPTMLFELSRGTWSNTEEMFRQFHTVTLKPWLKDWTDAYAQCLLTPEEQDDLYFEAVSRRSADHRHRSPCNRIQPVSQYGRSISRTMFVLASICRPEMAVMS